MIDWNKRRHALTKTYQQHKRSADYLSRLRILFAGASLLCLIFMWGQWWLALLGFVGFMGSVVFHRRAVSKCNHLHQQIQSCERMLARQSGKWHDFQLDTPVFLDERDKRLDSKTVLATHPYASDLDIFGKRSVFHMFNETGTFFGRAMLSHVLSAETDLPTAKLRQQAVSELCAKLDFCENLKATARLSGTTADPAGLIDYLKKRPKSKPLTHLVRYLPVLMWTAVGMHLFMSSPFIVGLMFTLMGLQLVAFLAYVPGTVPVLGVFSGFNRGLRQFAQLFKHIESENFRTELNRTMQSFLTQDSNSATQFLQKLATLEWMVMLRADGGVRLALNLLFLYDLQLVLTLEKLGEQHQNLARWLRTVGFFEAMVSLAGIGQAFPDWTVPELTATGQLSMSDMAHPLLHEPVTNCYTHGVTTPSDASPQTQKAPNTTIITGSNMSGKTTFMRAIGVNMALAYAGAPVRATSFRTPMVSLYTSMRIADSVTENVSTFYAELKRIKLIIDRAKRPEPMMFFIDEIFRGTNSEDRIEGAKRVLRQLDRNHVQGFITTHDLEVASEGVSNCVNCHFREFYQDGQIHFDYQVRAGISTTRNAQYLMAMVGIEG